MKGPIWWLRNNRYVPWHVRLLRKCGYWESEHEFKQCPSGERWCPHLHYRLGRYPGQADHEPDPSRPAGHEPA